MYHLGSTSLYAAIAMERPKALTLDSGCITLSILRSRYGNSLSIISVSQIWRHMKHDVYPNRFWLLESWRQHSDVHRFYTAIIAGHIIHSVAETWKTLSPRLAVHKNHQNALLPRLRPAAASSLFITISECGIIELKSSPSERLNR